MLGARKEVEVEAEALAEEKLEPIRNWARKQIGQTTRERILLGEIIKDPGSATFQTILSIESRRMDFQ